jgi:hypothetical protein
MSIKWLTKQSLSSNEKLFHHAKLCNDYNCIYPHCADGKKYLEHFDRCQFNNEKCKICDPVFQILMYHNHRCSKKNCSFLYCQFIKNKIKQNILSENNLIKSKVKNEIIIDSYIYSSKEDCLDRIKQNVHELVNLHYPKFTN